MRLSPSRLILASLAGGAVAVSPPCSSNPILYGFANANNLFGSLPATAVPASSPLCPSRFDSGSPTCCNADVQAKMSAQFASDAQNVEQTVALLGAVTPSYIISLLAPRLPPGVSSQISESDVEPLVDIVKGAVGPLTRCDRAVYGQRRGLLACLACEPDASPWLVTSADTGYIRADNATCDGLYDACSDSIDYAQSAGKQVLAWAQGLSKRVDAPIPAELLAFLNTYTTDICATMSAHGSDCRTAVCQGLGFPLNSPWEVYGNNNNNNNAFTSALFSLLFHNSNNVFGTSRMVGDHIADNVDVVYATDGGYPVYKSGCSVDPSVESLSCPSSGSGSLSAIGGPGGLVGIILGGILFVGFVGAVVGFVLIRSFSASRATRAENSQPTADYTPVPDEGV